MCISGNNTGSSTQVLVKLRWYTLGQIYRLYYFDDYKRIPRGSVSSIFLRTLWSSLNVLDTFFIMFISLLTQVEVVSVDGEAQSVEIRSDHEVAYMF